MSAKKPESMEDMKKLFGDIEGIKFETEREVTVRFR